MDDSSQKRKEEIYKLRSEGRTLQEIGNYYGITRERVRQILSNTYSRRRDLRIKYGISLEDYDRMLKEQNGVCRICGNPPTERFRLSVDHDHNTGRVRGLLCSRCNSAIGSLRDSIILLEKAIMYLMEVQ